MERRIPKSSNETAVSKSAKGVFLYLTYPFHRHLQNLSNLSKRQVLHVSKAQHFRLFWREAVHKPPGVPAEILYLVVGRRCFVNGAHVYRFFFFRFVIS